VNRLAAWPPSILPSIVPARLVLNTAGSGTSAGHGEVEEPRRSRVGPFQKRIDARLEFLMCDKSTVLEDLIENHRAINALLRR
jgi:hypothetical protein